MTLSLAVAQRNNMLATYGTQFNSGQLVVFSGAAPATADTALSADTILGACQFGSTAFAAPSGGSMSANAITETPATGTGTATFYRAYYPGASAAATACVAGNLYVINSPGSTAWTGIGAPNNSAGTVFLATGAGTGTGTCFPLTIIEQGAVGTSGAELNLNTVNIVADGPIKVTSFTRSM